MIVQAGSPTARLSEADIRQAVEKTLAAVPLAGKRVLTIIPDHTRSGPTGLFFRAIGDALAGKAARQDFLIALGTHPPMSEDKIAELLCMATDERQQRYGDVQVFNHLWNDPSALAQVGTLSRRQVEDLSGGMLSMDVPVLINRLVLDYDHLIIAGPVFPHEVVGFSGGHKYLFPGIAAPQIINFTHWLGALVTNPLINGTPDTPVRAAVEAAADLVPVERSLIGYVVSGDAVAGVLGGPVRKAWRAATELSAQVNIKHVDRPYQTILAQAPKMYDDIWTAGKCMYKMEPVVADGGTLIIHAPHIDEVSYSHGKVIDQIGYHVRDFFVRQWEKYKDFPWGVLAHSTHVRGIGTYENGVERPRVNVVLATAIPEARCRKINLGYMDPKTINPADYMNRECDGVLYVPKAGEVLYRLKNMSRFEEPRKAKVPA
ncbi:MAG TPA: lactate racemase domain-containing protein [Phycisphaerae bacterium]|nr:lactate racemase domain-containing protein [Phycisphaerae bacterium]